MSMQVSYKKQILFFLLGFLIIFLIIDIIAHNLITHLEVNSCAQKLTDANSGNNLNFEQICLNYSKLKTINTNDGFHAFVYPNQHSDNFNINSIGLRGEEIEKKSSDEFRIIVVGGSTVFGSKTPTDYDTIPSYLESLLSEKSRKITVINAGIGGASSYNEIKLIKEKLLSLEPDMLIIYGGWNDFLNSYISPEINVDSYSIDNHIFWKDIESITNTPRVIQKISHKINSEIFLLVYDKTNTKYALENSEVLSLKSEAWSKRWNNFCEEHTNIPTHIFLQPILGTGNKILSSYETQLLENPQNTNLSKYYEEYMRMQLLEIKNCNTYDLSNILDDFHEPVYFDNGHMFSNGNKFIAKSIYEKILPFIFNTPESNQMTVKTNMD